MDMPGKMMDRTCDGCGRTMRDGDGMFSDMDGSEFCRECSNPRSVFAAMRTPARRWWYHKKLRRQGQVDEARRREHRSIRAVIQDIRDCKANGGEFREPDEDFAREGRLVWTEENPSGHAGYYNAPVWPEQIPVVRDFMEG